MLVLGCMDLDLALRIGQPILTAISSVENKRDAEKWDRSNRMSLMIIKRGVPKAFRVHLVLLSLPAQFNQFKVSYNCQRDKWTLNELISFCVQEEERMKQETTESAHFASTSKGKGKRKRKEAATKGPVQKKQHLGNDQKKKESGPPKCFFCQEPGHLKSDCPKYHAWRVKKGLPELPKTK
ncbi:unnamed protein product [Lactuca virosa]|uniref:CCHC-type domain-containing protein n=1 Tax=Lactuca virosa TaxID=75947 RepID=A0AAU9PVM5_9ASTR|nr:unnamed protein product [Lactuca virosa]